MKYGVSGSRSLSQREKYRAAKFFLALFADCGPEDELFHGGAQGVDTIADTIARQCDMKVTPIIPTVFSWDGVGGFKQRNKRIVLSLRDEGTLFALHSSRSKTGGTIWTYNFAVRANVEAQWIDLTSEVALHESLSRNC